MSQGEEEEPWTTCCIAGGGPAGMMLGLLLARAGVAVTVLEKHHDFLRDFRGDTIHTSTIELMEELGLGERFLALPHEKAQALTAVVGATPIRICDFTALGGRHPYILFMPQWDFLDFVAGEARHYPRFRLRMGAEVVDVLREGEHTAGVIYREGGEERRLRADLTVACDGRDSVLRALWGEKPRDFGAPMDVLWFRLSRAEGDPATTGGRVARGRMLVTIGRGGYWQMAYVIPKGAGARVRAAGLPAFRAAVLEMCPFLEAARVQEIGDWDAVKTLEVKVNRLRRWHRPGLLYIGDAAHAMSPIGGVGINLAIQDAVAAANLLAAPLRERRLREADLAAVERRRRWPAAATQALQRLAQKRVIGSVLKSGKPLAPPRWLPRLLALGPVRRGVARLIGRGIRPEHVASGKG